MDESGALRPLLVALHLGAGAIALAAFWFPPFLRKGSRAHRTFGWIFVAAMSVILASAATMTAARLVTGNRDFALFFAFLTLISFVAVWNGIVVMRHKRDPAWLRAPIHLVFAIVIGLAGIGLLWHWWESRFPLLLAFGLLGVAIAATDLRKWRKPAAVGPRYWMEVHLESMIVSGMAAHIAFLAFGASRLWPDLYTGMPAWLVLLPWVAPFPIAFGAIALLKRHYRGPAAAG